MKRPLCAIAFAVAAISTGSALPIKWTATAAVTSASAKYAGVAVGDPVAIEFSYDSGATFGPITGLTGPSSSYYLSEFYQAVGLKIKVTIGQQQWESQLPTAALGARALLIDSWDGANAPDAFTVTTTASMGATFSSFPYQGTFAARSLQIVLTDSVVPCNLIVGPNLPGGQTPLSEITAATGKISAGVDIINFAINLASITVSEEQPSFPLAIERTETGVRLKWQSELGLLYRLEESDDLGQWTEIDTYPGTDAEIVVPLTPFAAHPARRYYRVVRED